MTISQNTQIQKITANSIIGVVTDFNSAVISTAYSKATYHSGSYPKFTGTATYGISGNQSPASTTTGWTNPNAIPSGQLDNKSNNPQLPGITDCLTYIPNDIKLKLDPLNVTVGGTPTNNKGVVSGFSTANYLTIASKFNTTDTWEIVGKFTTGSSFSSSMAIFHKEYALSLQISSDGKLDVYNWGSASHNYSSSALSINTTYWVKATINGSTKARTVQYSTDGSTWTDIISNQIDSSLDMANTTYPNVFCGRSSKEATMAFNGSISIPDTKIYKNGSLVLQGGTGQVTLKKGSKVYVPNGWTEQKETTITETEWYCFSDDYFYYYLKNEVPTIGETVYLIKDHANTPASSSSELSPSTLKVISNTNGQLGFDLMGTTCYLPRKPSGDLTKTTTTIVGSSSMVFDEVVISKDLTVSIASNNKWFIYYNVSDNNLWFADMAGTRSGTTNPSDLWGFFYNITDNKVYYLRNGTTPDNLTFSLPIAAVISNGTSITSINQTFNGMGYIGSTMFVLPGIKGIIPNGSTNINYENTTVALITVGTPGARDLFIKSNNALVDRYYHNQTTQPTITWCAWYNPSTNTYKESTSDSAVFTDEQMLFIANFTDDNASPQSKITSLTPRPLTSTTITASTLWNSMLNLTRTLVKIRKFTSKWYHKTNSTNNLVNTITSYATFNTYYPSLTSATLAVNVKGEYWTRSGSTSVTISPTSVLKNNATATSENINTAINNCYNAWVSTCYNANVLTYTFYTCHQNCHSQCHNSRGRR